MFSPLQKLLCVAAFASAAAAQISIDSSTSKNSIGAGKAFIINLNNQAPSDTVVESALYIGAVPCSSGCADPSQGLGSLIYSGTYNAPATGSSGYSTLSVPAIAPNYENGIFQLNLAHFYLEGTSLTPKTQYAIANITVTSATG